MADVDIEVGSGLRHAAAEVATAWKAAAAGQTVVSSDKIFFTDWEALCAVLTPQRYRLLRVLHRAPAATETMLAHRLEREDVRSVHDDVAALEHIGLVARSATGELSTAVAEIRSTIRFAA